MPTLRFDAGERTESLIQFVTRELDDATLDEIEIHREVPVPEELASEPITVGVTMVLGTATIAAVTRLVERWMETQRQLRSLQIVASAPTQEARETLARICSAHSQVAVSYELSREAWDRKS